MQIAELSNEELVNVLFRLDLRVAELRSDMEGVKRELRRRFPDEYGAHDHGDLRLQVIRNNRFNAAKAKKVLSPEILEMVKEDPGPSAKKANALYNAGVISEEDYQKCMDVHDPKIRVDFPNGGKS